MAAEKVVSRLQIRAGLLCGALFVCSVSMLTAPSPVRALNAEVLSPDLAPIQPELEGMIWQDELSSGERGRLVELVAWTIYRSNGLSKRAIQAVAAHDVDEAIPALRGEVVPDDKTIRALLRGEYSGWNQELREVTARAVEGDQPVVDGLWKGLRSRPELRPHQREDMIETLAIVEIKRIRAGESGGSILQGLPLSGRYSLLVELAPLPPREAVEDLVSRFLSSSRARTHAASTERQTYVLALETYGEEYFSWLPELLTPANRAKMGSEKTVFLLASTRRNLPRLEDRTALRLKEVLEMPDVKGSEKAKAVDRKAAAVESMRAGLVTKIERQLQKRADRQ